MKAKLLLLSAAFGLTSVLASGSPFTVTWNTDGISGISPPIEGDSSSGLITPIDLSRGADIDGASLSGAFSSNGWDSTDGGEYFEFGFTVASGYFVDLDESFLGLRSSNTGPRDMELLVSTDNFSSSSSVASYTLPGGSGASAWLNQSDDLSSLTNLTGTVLFRLSKTSEVAPNGGNIGDSGTFAFGRINRGDGLEPGGFSGTVTVIPEPSAALLALAGMGILARYVRKNRK